MTIIIILNPQLRLATEQAQTILHEAEARLQEAETEKGGMVRTYALLSRFLGPTGQKLN